MAIRNSRTVLCFRETPLAARLRVIGKEAGMRQRTREEARMRTLRCEGVPGAAPGLWAGREPLPDHAGESPDRKSVV